MKRYGLSNHRQLEGGGGGGDVYLDKLNLAVQVVLQRVQWSVTPPGEDQDAFVWGSSLHFFEGV